MKRLLLLFLVLWSNSVSAETPEEVKQRLEEYRQRVRDTEAYIKDKKEREYAETWQRYGDVEVKRTGWYRQADGSWNTEAKFNSLPLPEAPLRPTFRELPQIPRPKSFEQSLSAWVRQGILSPEDIAALRSQGSVTVTPTRPDRIAVNCTSLTVNTYRIGKWGTWRRPSGPLDPFEQLVIDRCSSTTTE